MPLQLKRILILLAVLVTFFVILRHFLVPESFGELGHFRANSIAENEDHVVKYVGTEYCVDCHDTEALLINEGTHKNLKCETCHGPGYTHVETTEKEDIILPAGREFCGLCHSLNAARPKNVIKQVNIAEHNIEESECINCHNPHNPWK